MGLLLFIASLPVCFAILCRMDGLNLKRHRVPYVLMHMTMFAGCVLAAGHGLEGVADLQDAAVLIASTCWLVVSWHTWKDGIPEHVHRQTT